MLFGFECGPRGRPYLAYGLVHLVIGALLFSSGVTWLIFTFYKWPAENYGNKTALEFMKDNPWNELPGGKAFLAWFVYTHQIWSGVLVS